MHQTVVRVVIEMWNVTSFDDFVRKVWKRTILLTSEKYWIIIDGLLLQTQCFCCCQDWPTSGIVGAECTGLLTSVGWTGLGLCQSYYPDIIDAVKIWNFRHMKNKVSSGLSVGDMSGKMRCPLKILSFLATFKLPFIASSATYNHWW